MMNSIPITFLLMALLSSASAFSSRRVVFEQIISTATITASSVIVSTAGIGAANAVDVCPKGSKNCIRTKWLPPSGTEAKVAVNTLKGVIEGYPQDGQSKVDGGGWVVSSSSSFSPGSTVSIEYKSGIGNFAKFLNGGKPFVDDLTLEVGLDGGVDVRSSSRIGESDMGVNQKRLSYIAAMLNKEGWTCEEAKY